MPSRTTFTNHPRRFQRIISPSTLLSVIINLLFSTQLVSAGSGCFFPNGTENPLARKYQPCNPDAKVSMCCAIGPDRIYPPKDRCLDSGLCLGDPDDARIYWRESCTDPTWKSPECVGLCTGPEWVDKGDVWLTVCEQDGKFCCGRPSTLAAQNCCKNGEGFHYNATMPNAEQIALGSGGELTIEPERTTTRDATEETTSPTGDNTADPSSNPTEKSEPSSSSGVAGSGATANAPKLSETLLPNAPAPAASTSNPTKTLEGGVVAGIAIASAVSAVLLFYGALLFVRRRKTRFQAVERHLGPGIDAQASIYVSHENLRMRDHGPYYSRGRHPYGVEVGGIHELPDRRYTVQQAEGGTGAQDDQGYTEKGIANSSQEALNSGTEADAAASGDRLPGKM